MIVSMLPARHRNQSYITWRFQRVGMGVGWGWGWGWGGGGGGGGVGGLAITHK